MGLSHRSPRRIGSSAHRLNVGRDDGQTDGGRSFGDEYKADRERPGHGTGDGAGRRPRPGPGAVVEAHRFLVSFSSGGFFLRFFLPSTPLLLSAMVVSSLGNGSGTSGRSARLRGRFAVPRRIPAPDPPAGAMPESPPLDKRFGTGPERRYAIRHRRRYNGIAPQRDDRPSGWSGRQLAPQHARRGCRRVGTRARREGRERATSGRLGCKLPAGGKRSIAG
jgi:hypothetical protein